MAEHYDLGFIDENVLIPFHRGVDLSGQKRRSCLLVVEAQDDQCAYDFIEDLYGLLIDHRQLQEADTYWPAELGLDESEEPYVPWLFVEPEDDQKMMKARLIASGGTQLLLKPSFRAHGIWKRLNGP